MRGTADTSLVKPAYSKVSYTTNTLKEFQLCCHPQDGPLFFMTNFMRIQHPTRGGIPFEPFDYQLELIENYNNNNIIYLTGGFGISWDPENTNLGGSEQAIVELSKKWIKPYRCLIIFPV